MEEKNVVTPWEVEGGKDGIDYDRIVAQFGCHLIDEAVLERFKAVTKQEPHTFLRRGLFFSHRDLGTILTLKEENKPFYLYTGRGPSSELHVGHLIPFLFTKYLQDIFDVPVVIQLTDDEKFLFKDMKLEACQKLALENAKDIIAVGFNPAKTFMFRNTDYMGVMYPNVIKISKLITANQAIGCFGFDGSSSLGRYFYPAVQAAPSFSSSFPTVLNGAKIPCLIPCGIDQDPFFRMTRDVASRMKERKPACIHSRFFPALQGPAGKMSSSVTNSAIFLSDGKKLIAKKINKHAFSGGRDSVEEHREHGGNTDVDVPYQYLRVFEDDDAKLAEIKQQYESGQMLTGEIKKILIEKLQGIILAHQERRSKVTDAEVRAFMAERNIFNP